MNKLLRTEGRAESSTAHAAREARERARVCVSTMYMSAFDLGVCVWISISMRILICNYYEAHLCSSSRAVTLIYSCVPNLKEATLAVLRAHSHTISHSPNSPHSQSRWRFNPALSHTPPTHQRFDPDSYCLSVSPCEN